MMGISACSQQVSIETTTSTAVDIPTSTSSTSTTSTTLPQPTSTLPPSTTTTTTLVPQDGLSADQRTLTKVATIGSGIAPKSVVASGSGLFFAQNMMYRHTITVYDRNHELVETISDRVAPADYGYTTYQGEYDGSPVEAAFTSDGRFAYVSNYKMYGGGLSTSASDGCNAGNWPDSFVYRVDTETLAIDQLIPVGSVPKFLAVTPNDRLVVVSNWCGFDVSIIDVEEGAEIGRIPVGRHPRGIAISSDSGIAYVAVMGSRDIAMVDLGSLELIRYIEDVGRSPRHLVISPEGDVLYVSLNGEGRIAKVNLDGEIVESSVATGAAPRSVSISDDGTALYVVNYNSNTVSKVRTSDMVELEEHPTNSKPIGVTYDAATREVWVSNYSGTIQVWVDGGP